MNNYITKKSLIKKVFRMPKDYSSFLYFTLESNENMAFYSTLSFEKGQNYRDVEVYTTPELEENIDSIISHLIKKIPLELLSTSVINDQR